MDYNCECRALSLSAPNEIKTIVPISSNGPQPPEVDGTIPLKLAKTPKKLLLEKYYLNLVQFEFLQYKTLKIL